MKKRKSSLYWLCALIAFAIGISDVKAEEAKPIYVFAAASLTDVLNDIAKKWERAGHRKVVLSFAASPVLAKQIEEGAPADIYASADMNWMNYLQERNLIVADTLKTTFGNNLVWIAPTNAPDPKGDILSLLGDGRLALADPDHVPAGRYAKQALIYMGQWEKVANRLAPASDVRSALTLVERGEAPLGIVYATDTKKSDVRVLEPIPAEAHDSIVIPFAVLSGHDRAEVRDFLDFIFGPMGIETFHKFGFLIRN